MNASKKHYLAAIVLALVAVPLIVMYAAGIGVFNARVQASLAKKNINANVTRQVFNPSNKIQSQGYFEALRADYGGFIAKIAVQKQLVASDASAFNETNLAGLRQECIDAAQTYNAAALSISSEAFRTADLPHQINPGACSQ